MQPLCSDRHWYNNAAGSELTISPNFSIRESVIESVLRFFLLFPLKIVLKLQLMLSMSRE